MRKRLAHVGGLPVGTLGAIDKVSSDSGVCEKFSQTPVAPVFSTRATQHFDQHIEMDLLVRDFVALLHVTDVHTHINAARLVSGRKSSVALEGLRNMWFLSCGIPGEVAPDAAGE